MAIGSDDPNPHTRDARRLRLVAIALAGLFVVLFLLKCAVASNLDLFCDEAFYWQCAQRPSICYVDHPPMAAMLVLAGTELFGDTTLGVRVFFILIGLFYPLVLYRLALVAPTGSTKKRRDALLAAAAAIVLPGAASLGLVATPDTPLTFLAAVLLIAFERATRLRTTGAWIVAGACGALGLMTHYRFSVVLFGAGLYIVLTRNGRSLLRDARFWLGALLVVSGAAPAIIVNLATGFVPIEYYLEGRHGAAPSALALLIYLGKQFLVVTPFLFIALAIIAVTLVRRARAGDDRAALFAIMGITPFAVYFIASPFENSGLPTIHWPLPSYPVLLVLLPAALRRFVSSAKGTMVRRRRVAAGAVIALGPVVVLVGMLELGTKWVRLSTLRWNFEGWQEATAALEPHLAACDEGAMIIADNYRLAAFVDFHLGGTHDVYSLDHPKNHSHGRARQMALWKRGERAIRERAGEPAVLVIQSDDIPHGQVGPWLAHATSFIDKREPVQKLVIDSEWRKSRTGKPKQRRFMYFSGRVPVARP